MITIKDARKLMRHFKMDGASIPTIIKAKEYLDNNDIEGWLRVARVIWYFTKNQNIKQLSDGPYEFWTYDSFYNRTNPELTETGSFLNGKKEGLNQTFNYYDGKLIIKCNFRNGYLYGSYEAWYPTLDHIEKRYMYDNGKHGICEEWIPANSYGVSSLIEENIQFNAHFVELPYCVLGSGATMLYLKTVYEHGTRIA